MDSILNKLFGFNRKYTTVRTEILAGITSFLTMAYIPAVNPAVLSITGMDKGALFTATILASVLATMLMAFYASCPTVWRPAWGLRHSSPTPYACQWAIHGSLRLRPYL